MSVHHDELTQDRAAVEGFVAEVRSRLHDLPIEEQQELIDGLAADLMDQVAESGLSVLDDPDAYARELRAAAGFPAVASPKASGGSLGVAIHAMLDGAHRRTEALLSGLPGDPWGFLVAVRPLWWVLRAWMAVQLVDLLFGNGSYGWGIGVVPTLRGLGLPALLIAVLVSVQLGRGKLAPRLAHRNAGGRTLLVALNALAIATLPVVGSELITPAKAASWSSPEYATEPGLVLDGQPVENIYPYDSQGSPLFGVQLIDQDGRPLRVGPWVADQKGALPWRNGKRPMWGTYPMGWQARNDLGESYGDPRLMPPPFATLGEVTAPELVDAPTPLVVKQPADSQATVGIQSDDQNLKRRQPSKPNQPVTQESAGR